MINTNEVIEFFDRLAPNWDADMIRYDDVIGLILDNAGVKQGKDILDVACGTGVLFPDYFSRDVALLTAIDISPKMIEIARNKFGNAVIPSHNNSTDHKQPTISIICGDVEVYDFGRQFDCIVVYNAFPHFPDPDRLVSILSKKLKPNGILTIAHGMSREKINSHHKGSASHVSNGLMSAEELALIFEKYLDVTTMISDDRMYQVAGKYRG